MIGVRGTQNIHRCRLSESLAQEQKQADSNGCMTD